MKYRKPQIKFRSTFVDTKVVAEKKKANAWTFTELEILKKQAEKNKVVVKRKAVKILNAQLAKKNTPEVQAILDRVLKSVQLGKPVPEKIVRACELELKYRDPEFQQQVVNKIKKSMYYSAFVVIPTTTLVATILLNSCQH